MSRREPPLAVRERAGPETHLLGARGGLAGSWAGARSW